jgi:molybdate transport system ATP-binding protein
MSACIVHIDHLNLQFQNKRILQDLSWEILTGEHWLLSGKSGSGKTVLAKVIAGLIHAQGTIDIHFNDRLDLPAKVLFVAQWFTFKDKQGGSNFYYQQRYNSQDAENSATVLETLSIYAEKLKKGVEDIQELLKHFDLWHRKDAPLLQLSSGEHKKIQLTKALLLRPQLLILDNPYTGLDVQSRANLNELLDHACQQGMQLILISNDGQEPSCINRFARLDGGKLIRTEQAKDYASEDLAALPELPDFLNSPLDDCTSEIIRLKNVNVSYGEKKVLQDIQWTVNKGDKWLLGGHNGSGKSTLLSLLTGDNPQAYASEIYLFGKRRGTGESIWDIKKNIGFISPELQWYFEPGSTVFQTVASGFFDTSGLFRTISTAQAKKVKELLSLFGLEEDRETLLKQLPLGKQRITLLARAIVKNPPLLILDEPCQGLDTAQTRMLNGLVDRLCTADRTLIYVGHFADRLPASINKKLILNAGIASSTAHLVYDELTR